MCIRDIQAVYGLKSLIMALLSSVFKIKLKNGQWWCPNLLNGHVKVEKTALKEQSKYIVGYL